MNVQIAKTVALVAVLLGLSATLLLAIRWQADTTTIVGLAAAVGTGAAAAFRWLTGDKGPPTGPVAVLALVGASLGLGGCAPAATPREQARTVVLRVAEGVRIGDEACASIAIAKKDLELATGCAAARLEARELLLLAEEGVDAWDAAADNKIPCAVAASARALSRMLDMIERAGGKAPPAVGNALKVAPLLAGACRG